MKILFGVCGEGRGHAIRSRILIRYLQQQGHEVRIVAGRRAYMILSKEFDSVLQIESLHVFYKGNQVRIAYTLLHTLYQMIARTPVSFRNIRTLLRDFQPDVLITDAEPISHFAARFNNVKRISIDNPSVLLYKAYQKRIKDFPSWLFLCFCMKLSLFGADKYLIYDFFDEKIQPHHVLFVKPLIQPGILDQSVRIGNHLLVYQTSLSFSPLFNALKKFNETFIVYGFDTHMTDGNIIYKRFNEEEFYRDISSAKAVIINGGFTVISEALYLKKPIFCLPIRHQFEQVYNARCVDQMGVGVSHEEFYEEDLQNFLLNLSFFSENLQRYHPGEQNETLATIEHEITNIINSVK